MSISKNVLGEIDLLIFDLDGTLVDSQLDLVLGVNATRRHMNLGPLPNDVIAALVGRGVNVLISQALGDQATEENIEKGLEFFLDYYHQHMLDNTVTYPGVREALEELQDRKLAILTNKPVNFSREMIRRLGMDRYFLFVYGGNSFPQKKPDPVGTLALMKDTGASPAQTIIVGDSDTDVLTGQAAGIWTCGVTYGFGAHSLENSPPDLLLGDLRDLPLLLNTQGCRQRQ